ncbi:MAG TPA: hypothetical protein VMM92_00435, partial [Thermoanaerobaculia bacterium]|nr:hypothetical protein [Thermoanaerobaculia bacterium]
PFSGRFLGAGDMPIPRAIGELRFAYGPGAAGRQMQPPPNTLPLSALTEEAAGLFERAFSTRGRGEEGRPKPREWVAALEALGRDLQVCNRSPAHHFRRGLAACPWCEIESRSAVLLFWLGAPVPGAAGGTFQLALIWARIAAVPHPGKAPSLPDLQSLRPPPSPAAEREGRVRRWRFLCGMFVGLAGPLLSLTLGSLAWLLAPVFLVIAWRIARGGSRPVHDQARLELRVAQAELARLSQAWKTEAGPSAFEAQSQELEKRRAAYLDLPAARQRRLDYLRVNLRQKQLDRYLDSHRLERARIKGIGPARKATLQSFGIETAADVDPFAIPRIPGFGPVMTESLVLWRQELERSFVYDPHRGIDPADLRALETSLATEKAQLERDLAAGAAKLDQLRQRTLRRREELLPLLNAALGKVAQVQADLAVL